MGRKSKKKALNRVEKKHWTKAATALWDLAANRRIPDAIRLLFEMIGLRVVLALLARKAGGDESVDAEAVKKIAGAIERTQVRG
ncbi:hypothetical protein QUA62_26645 [Microcoleus sp. MON1_C1]|uniref:hypothetical protein n=1 Tax=Microcoleus sp. MON1_C1 TaxID=2818827 RepID=UPI002FD213B8